jgi:membrane-associated phospholipid phosphatase
MVDRTGHYGWLAIVPLTMFGRVYFGLHWITDTIAGALVGGAVGAAAVAIDSAAKLKGQ